MIQSEIVLLPVTGRAATLLDRAATGSGRQRSDVPAITFDQIMFSSVQRAYEMGAAGVGATIYFGSEQSSRQIVETVQSSTTEAMANGILKGNVDVREKGPVAR